MILAIMLIIGVVPAGSLDLKNVKAADTGTAAFANLGNLGTVNIGSKSESGQWHKIKIGNDAVFCMDLGKACYTGYSYTSSEEETISSSSSNTGRALKARVAYWFDQTKKRADKAYVYSQTLIWAIEEGQTSEEQLTGVIRQVRTNTGYYDSNTAKQLYSEIFGGNGEVTATIKTWTYSGTSSKKDSIQRLLYIKATGTPANYEPKSLNIKEQYKQKINFTKYSETRVPLANATFKITALNTKELEKFEGYGMTDGAENGEDAVTEMTLNTDSSGNISCYFTYNIQSKDYYYYSADDLKKMSADDKKAAKAELKENGYLFASDLTENSAWDLAYADAIDQKAVANCSYEIEEISANNANIYDGYFTATSLSGDSINVAGKKVTLSINGNNSWWADDEGAIEDQFQARLEIRNNYKKVSVNVVKKDNYSSDGKAHGDAVLDGAVYQLYGNPTCSYEATVYNADGTTKVASPYTVVNGHFETDYLQSGKTYYLKEIKNPEGYFISGQIFEIKADATQYVQEYTANAQTVEAYEQPTFGKVQIFKTTTDGSTGPAQFEEGAEFQIYLKSKGSYEACDEYERATLTIGKDGSGTSVNAHDGYLYYGTYVIHQTSTGGNDTEMIDDQEIEIAKDITDLNLNGKTYVKLYNNKPFETFIKIIKKDGDTDKTVLKANTKYQIFKVGEDGSETQIIQQYSNGNKLVDVDTYVTDESGEVMTVKALKPGKYKIYEVDSASGLYIKDKYIEVEINSKNSNYTSYTDSEGNSHALITIEYVNKEAKGKLTLTKTGEVLKSFNKDVSNPEKNKFNYKDEYLKGQTFNIYAADTIVTQDNQGTNWFDKGELVATVTTCKGADFTKQCSDITIATVDDETGAVTVYLPLGKYTVKEETTLYGFVIPEKNTWDIEFKWNDAKTDVVSNSTKDTDKEGNLNIKNERAKADVEINKKDMTADIGVADTVFNLYTKNDIYNADGELLLKADELITTVKTDKNGKASLNTDLPLMSEGYNKAEDKTGFNSGDYYFVEDKISDSYYIDKTPVDIHLEYKDAKTAKIKAEAKKLNKSTEINLSKVKLTDSTELAGASLKVIDDKGNEIISWVSGNADSIKITDKADELGYRNLRATMVNGNLVINGLLQNAVYEMTETRPADGFATAESIRFKLTEGNANGEVTTIATVIGNDGSESVQPENKVVMKDDTIKVNFSKTKITGSKELPGCKLEITDENGNVIEKWTSGKKPYIVEGKLVAGKTYKFAETRPKDGYATAETVKFTVSDTGEIQKVRMKDDTIKVEVLKTDKKDKDKVLKDAEFTFKLNGKVVAKATTNSKGIAKIYGKLAAGKTYRVEESKAPEGYKKVPAFDYKVKDTGDIQIIKVSDERSGDATPNTPNWNGSGAVSPKTGDMSNPLLWIMLFVLSSITLAVTAHGMRKKDEE